MKYAIIGNSAAAIGAVEGIRQVDKQGEITIYTSEPHHTYSRPLISYLLYGKVTKEKMKYRGDDFYEKNNVKVVYETVTDIGELKCDKLLIATGSSPFVPPFEGLDTVKEKFTFMSLDDAENLEKALDKNKKVLIIGAGLIGLKCAEGILGKGVAGNASVAGITVVDLAPRILSSILDEDGAKIVQNHLENKGIEFKLSVGVKNFVGAAPNKAILDNGETINFDILVLAVGVRPNTGLLKIERGGIPVNEKSETSVPNVYAAGDCTQYFDVSSGQNKIMALLPNAYMQGECAGINMAGGEKKFDKAIPMNAIGFFGLHIITAGNYVGDVYEKKVESEELRVESYKKLFYNNNKLNGYILIGDVEKAGIYTSLIRERTPLDSIDFALVCEKPGLMAFAKNDRMEKLGA